MTNHLSQDQIDRYWKDGFLFPIRVLSEADTAAARTELEDIERDWLDAGLPRPLNMYKRTNAQCVMPLAARIATDPSVLDAVEGVLGPDLMVWSAEFFIKEANTTHIVGMHQDLTYWGLGETPDLVTAWVALSPATTASGCMDFVAGSHENPILPHNDTFSENNLLSRGQEVAVDVADEDITHIELQPGEMSLHHGLMIHGSGPNVSDDRRIGLAIRYLNPNARQQVANKDFAMLARGADLQGNFIHYAAPARNFESHSIAIYEQIFATQNQALAEGIDTSELYSGRQDLLQHKAN